MALPKRRWSTRRQGKKRKSLGIKLPTLVSCSNCNQPTLSHHVCPACGYYKGKEIVKTKMKGKVEKKLGKKKMAAGKADKKTRNTEAQKDAEASKKRKGR